MRSLIIYPPDPTGDIIGYNSPSPETATVRLPSGSFVHVAYFPYPDPPTAGKPKGKAHAVGNCGGAANLCGQCWDIELAWHKRIAERMAQATPPRPEENWRDWWLRARGRMLDTWCDAASHALTHYRQSSSA